MKTSQTLLVSFPRMLDRAVWYGSLGLIGVVIGAASLQAQTVIATYDISTANATVSPSVTPTTDPNVTAANLTTTGVVPGNNLPGSYLWRLWGASTSPNLTKYMTWSVTPTAGNQIDFSGANATFSLAFGADSATIHGADTWQLHGSTDNFATSDITLGSTMTLPFANQGQQIPETVSLGGLGTQLGTVTFRLYGYNDTKQDTLSDSGGLANAALPGTGGNLIINGAVSAVPEPSSYAAVFGALAFGFVFLTRRLRKA